MSAASKAASKLAKRRWEGTTRAERIQQTEAMREARRAEPCPCGCGDSLKRGLKRHPARVRAIKT